MPWAFGDTRSLTHSLTHSLHSQIKHFTVASLLILSITFVPSAFYAYVWRIVEGAGKAYIFSRHIIHMGFVLIEIF